MVSRYNDFYDALLDTVNSGVPILPTPALDIVTGRKSGIGPSGVPLFNSSLSIEHSITIVASSGNSDNIWVGVSGLTTNSNDDTDGFPLFPSDRLEIRIRQSDSLYVTSTQPSGQSDQSLWWSAV